MQERAEKLVSELRQCGLEPVDAHRMAFLALARGRGWSSARIGRWLGITRARVGQRIDKLWVYAARDDVPLLTEIVHSFADVKQAPSAGVRVALTVAYNRAEWDDLPFAQQLIEIVARPIDS